MGFFRSVEELLKLYQEYEHIIVDEFQDTNELQFELLKHLIDPRLRPCLSQSVYF